jgi:hypothetical protein
MRVFVGNATKQILKFSYRAPGKGVRTQDVPIGGQVILSGDLTPEEVECALSQNAKYGLIDVKEIDRSKAFIGMCYSLDRPISLSYLQRALDQNHNVLVERGKEIRTNAAIAVNQGLETELAESGLGRVANLEMSVIEEDSPKRPVDAGPMISEGVRVSHDAPEHPSPPSRAPSRSSRRRAA